MAAPSLYLQLYSLRHETAADAEGTVRRVPGLGFDGVELVGTYGWPADRWRALLDETGLKVIAAHVGLDTLEKDLPSHLTFYRALGTRRLVVTALPRAPQSSARYHDGARRLNAIGYNLAAEGFSLVYHNHSYEFEPLEKDGAVCGLDLLLTETDPTLVRFEFDTFWLEAAGHDAVTFIRRHAARVALIHAKDLRKRDREDVPAGQGDVDFRTLVPLCSVNDWPVILEYERDNAIEAVRQGAHYLRELLAKSCHRS